MFDPFESPWKPREAIGKAKAESAVPTAGDAPSPPPEPVSTDAAFDSVDDMKAAVEAYEKRILEAALAKSRYNQRQTAKALNLTYDQLRHSLKRHDLLGS